MAEITLADVEEAVEEMRTLGRNAQEVYRDARLAETSLKRIHALEAKLSKETSVAARQLDAYASERYGAGAVSDANAYAAKQVHEHNWDLAKTIISVWQSKVKDRS